MKRVFVLGVFAAMGCNGGSLTVRSTGHKFDLPAATPDVAYVEALAFPTRDPQLVRPSADGYFDARARAADGDGLFVIHVKNLAVVPAPGDGAVVESNLAWQQGADVGRLLLTAAELARPRDHINLLTEFVSRRMDDYVDRLPMERIQYFEDSLAKALITSDIDGDGVVSYDDALQLDPSLPEHRAKLAFDYDALLDKTLDCGCTLRQTYATEPEAVGERLNEAFADLPLPDLPPLDVDQLGVTLVSTGIGGTIRIDEHPDITLTPANHQYKHLSNPFADTTITLRAVPDDRYKFVRWVGCDQPQPDGSCVMPSSTDDRTVSAQFGMDPALADGVDAVVRMMDVPEESYAVTADDAGVLTYTAVAGSEADAALSTVKPGSIVATGLAVPPLVRVTSIVAAGAAVDATHVRYVLGTEEVDPSAVYARVSAFEEDRPTTIDDVQSITVTDPPADPVGPSPAGVRRVMKPVWIVGYGRAFELGNGFYLAQPPGSAKMGIFRAESAPVPRERAAGKVEACTILTGKECVLQLAEVKGTYNKIFQVKLKLEASIDLALAGHMDYGFPTYVHFETRGRFALSLGAALSVGVTAKGALFKSCTNGGSGKKAEVPDFATTGDPLNDAFIEDVLDTSTGSLGTDKNTAAAAALTCKNEKKTSLEEKKGAPKAEATLKEVEMDVAKSTPAGVAFPGKVKFKLGVESKGQFGLSLKYVFESAYTWEAGVQWGTRCAYVVSGCESFNSSWASSRFDSGQKLSGALVANAEIAPFVSAGVYTGVRGLKDDLVRLEGKLSVPIRVAGYLGSATFSTLPADKAAGTDGLCFSAETGIVWGIDLRAEIGAVIDTRFEKWGLEFGGEWDLFRLTYKYPLIPVAASKFSLGKEATTCTRPDDLPVSRLDPSVRWSPGELTWDNAPSRKLTKTHELVLQTDGNLVLYRLVRKADGTIDKRVALWSTETHTYYGSRVAFQADGNFVLYSVGERAIWKTDTVRSDVGWLELQADGNHVIYSKDGSAIWATGTNGK